MSHLITTITSTALLTSWLLVSPVLAFEAGGVQIKGNVEQNVTGRTVTNFAGGTRAHAGQSIGAIHGGTEIGGSVKQNVTVRTATNFAGGTRSKACQEIGSIGDNPACK